MCRLKIMKRTTAILDSFRHFRLARFKRGQTILIGGDDRLRAGRDDAIHELLNLRFKLLHLIVKLRAIAM